MYIVPYSNTDKSIVVHINFCVCGFVFACAYIYLWLRVEYRMTLDGDINKNVKIMLIYAILLLCTWNAQKCSNGHIALNYKICLILDPFSYFKETNCELPVILYMFKSVKIFVFQELFIY